MSRLVSAGSIIRSQLDFYSPPNSVTRAAGVTVAALSAVTFFNNSLTNWTLVDGTSVPDVNIASGSIFFNEIVGSPSYYSVRFFPDRVGYWRIIFLNLSLSSQSILEFDVVAAGAFQSNLVSSGLNAAFVK